MLIKVANAICYYVYHKWKLKITYDQPITVLHPFSSQPITSLKLGNYLSFKKLPGKFIRSRPFHHPLLQHGDVICEWSLRISSSSTASASAARRRAAACTGIWIWKQIFLSFLIWLNLWTWLLFPNICKRYSSVKAVNCIIFKSLLSTEPTEMRLGWSLCPTPSVATRVSRSRWRKFRVWGRAATTICRPSSTPGTVMARLPRLSSRPGQCC